MFEIVIKKVYFSEKRFKIQKRITIDHNNKIRIVTRMLQQKYYFKYSLNGNSKTKGRDQTSRRVTIMLTMKMKTFSFSCYLIIHNVTILA